MPLSRFKVIELGGLAPIALCGMILSDFGANVIRLDNYQNFLKDESLSRGKKSISLNLKIESQRNILRKILKNVDVLLDPFRPGVLEKLNLGPLELHKDNPRLIIGRLTGYGQPSPNDSDKVLWQKMQAGHDINYVSLSGTLSKLGLGIKNVPQPPINLLADFGGGSFNLAFGILLALLNREHTMKGEVIDCSMTLGCAYMSSFFWRTRDLFPVIWPNPDKPGSNLIDGGAPFYRCYRTKDDKFVSVGALEPKFYSSLLKLLGISEYEAPQIDTTIWTMLSKRFAEIFATKTQEEWVDAAANNNDCCIAPILELDEAAQFWGDSFIGEKGTYEPKPHPVFQVIKPRDESKMARPTSGEHTKEMLLELGCSQEEVDMVLKINMSANI